MILDTIGLTPLDIMTVPAPWHALTLKFQVTSPYPTTAIDDICLPSHFDFTGVDVMAQPLLVITKPLNIYIVWLPNKCDINCDDYESTYDLTMMNQVLSGESEIEPCSIACKIEDAAQGGPRFVPKCPLPKHFNHFKISSSLSNFIALCKFIHYEPSKDNWFAILSVIDGHNRSMLYILRANYSIGRVSLV